MGVGGGCGENRDKNHMNSSPTSCSVAAAGFNRRQQQRGKPVDVLVQSQDLGWAAGGGGSKQLLVLRATPRTTAAVARRSTLLRRPRPGAFQQILGLVAVEIKTVHLIRAKRCAWMASTSEKSPSAWDAATVGAAEQ